MRGLPTTTYPHIPVIRGKDMPGPCPTTFGPHLGPRPTPRQVQKKHLPPHRNRITLVREEGQDLNRSAIKVGALPVRATTHPTELD